MTWITEWFEANYLDGDKVQEGQMLSSKECLEAIEAGITQTLQEIKDEYGHFNNGCGCCMDEDLSRVINTLKQQEHET